MNNMTVAWVRIRDTHILTVDTETFISDNRFGVQPARPSSTLLFNIVGDKLNVTQFTMLASQ